LSEALARHRAGGKPLFDLTASNPTECGFDYDSELDSRGAAESGGAALRAKSKGLESTRLAVRVLLGSGAAVSAEDIVLTSSTSEADSFVFRLLCNPGDELLIPAPSYPLFGFLPTSDVKLVRYSLIYITDGKLICWFAAGDHFADTRRDCVIQIIPWPFRKSVRARQAE